MISPFLPHVCRYVPSCSSYFVEAVRRFGIIKGSIMGIARIARCRNSYFGGPDPVPTAWSFKIIKDDYIARKKPKDFDASIKA